MVTEEGGGKRSGMEGEKEGGEREEREGGREGWFQRVS